MPDWTKTNFDDLRDVSPQDAPMHWRFAREALRSPELGVSRFTYDPAGQLVQWRGQGLVAGEPPWCSILSTKYAMASRARQ